MRTSGKQVHQSVVDWWALEPLSLTFARSGFGVSGFSSGIKSTVISLDEVVGESSGFGSL